MTQNNDFLVRTKNCVLCGNIFNNYDRIYFVAYGEKSKIPLMPNKEISGQICYDCCRKVDLAIRALKK